MPISRPEEYRALDRWLQQSLIQRYSATLREPLPDALLKLLDEGKG